MGRLVYKDFLGKASKGSEYDAFARAILAGLPEQPRRKALALRERLDARILNTDLLTVAERAKRTEKQMREAIDPHDLGAAVRRGSTSGFGMFLLFLNLAKDAGLKPTVALVTDRDERIFRPSLLAPFQLDRYLVGVTEPGAPTMWLDPAVRFGSDTIPPDYQGTKGLELDMDTWTLKPVSILPQPAEYNVRRFTYDLNLGAEADQFAIKAEFNGYPDYEARWRFLKLEPGRAGPQAQGGAREEPHRGGGDAHAGGQRAGRRPEPGVDGGGPDRGRVGTSADGETVPCDAVAPLGGALGAGEHPDGADRPVVSPGARGTEHRPIPAGVSADHGPARAAIQRARQRQPHDEGDDFGRGGRAARGRRQAVPAARGVRRPQGLPGLDPGRAAARTFILEKER